jgi:hypothetical protein
MSCVFAHAFPASLVASPGVREEPRGRGTSQRPSYPGPICGSTSIILSQSIQTTILKVLLFWRTS